MDTETTETKNEITINLGEEAPACTVYWNGLEIEVKKVLPLAQMLGFVEGVVSSCFDSDTGEYKPEFKDFLIRCAIIEMYTNIEMPENVESKYRLVYETDIMQSIIPSISRSQYDVIMEAIDKKIEHTAQSNIQALTQQLNEIANKFAELEDSFSKVFDGVDSQMITDMASAVTNNGITEETLLKMAMDQKERESKVVPITKRDE